MATRTATTTSQAPFLQHPAPIAEPNSSRSSTLPSRQVSSFPTEGYTSDRSLGREGNLQRPTTNASGKNRKSKWWNIQLFRGMVNDVRRRAPYYFTDWTDAWDYRVVPATIYMYFANILPALAFSLDMFTKTNMSYGVNEVLLSSVLGSVVFAVFAAQPLVIVGVTGPITVFNYTVYDIISPTGTNYFAFMCWIGLWSLVMHWILAITNSCNGLRYVTRFSCDTFGFYVAFIYLQKGIQVLTRQFAASDTPFYVSVMVALLVLGVAYLCGVIGTSQLFQHYIRTFIKDYGTPLTVIFFTGFVHIGSMRSVTLQTLPTGASFEPTSNRGWFVDFWEISVGEVFTALPFAILLTILFWFDHNVSSLIAQGTEFPLRKPAGFHWDIFLLGLTTGVAGLLGIPFPNGLIPQAPFHTDSLCVKKVVQDDDEGGDNKGHMITKVDHVVEQRFSNLMQGLLTLVTMSPPLLVVIGLIPQGVLAGLFFVMGVQALEGNGITLKLLFLARDETLTPKSDPLKRVTRRSAIWAFVAIQLVGFGATFAITQTIAAIGFPIIILLLIPVRTFILPKWFTQEELNALDAPTASPFTMISVGGNHGEVEDESSIDAAAASGISGVDTPRNGVLNDRGDGESSEEALAERGEAKGVGSQKRDEFRTEGSGRRVGESIEMQKPGMNRRSVSRQQR